ncbi:hypothetical protein [Vibrio maerlii]|uniref:hypothetical protein n=1 Tax=Vibrio maerlii TaxID=2231648 RepID=UPI000E3E3503|nr:hypothetical protein [Vibrio maerlii]
MTPFVLFGTLISLLIVLGFVQRKLEWVLFRRLFLRGQGYLYSLTRWVGTPVHELSHVVMCVVFRHRIVKIEWVDPTGLGGAVIHQWNPKSYYQNLGNIFIATAPFYFGVFLIVLLTHFVFPSSLFLSYVASISELLVNISQLSDLYLVARALVHSVIEFNSSAIEHGLGRYCIWLFISTSIVARMIPSSADFGNALRALIYALPIIAILTVAIGLSGLISAVNTLLSVAIVFWLFFLVVYLIYMLLILLVAKLLP